MSHAAMIETYLQGPALLRQAVAGMTRAQLLAKPIPGKMSTLEVVAHLADFEPVLADRMKRIIALERPPLVSASEDDYLAKLAYHERDVEEELKLIEVTRSQMARILRALPAEAWARVGMHTEKGERTLEQILTVTTNHIPHHLPFIAAKRQALGA